jgi:HSP20 family protein
MITKVTDTLRDTQDLAEDARQLLAEIDRDVPGAARINADCRPPIDVFETTAGLEVVVDVPGVPADSLRVVVRRSTLLIVGAKMTGGADRASRYHIAERSYGRFARAVRLAGAFDAARARAITQTGQLRITLPRLDDRRGQVLRIPVERE